MIIVLILGSFRKHKENHDIYFMITTMHSAQLQKSFVHLYEQFFSTNKIIFSAPFLLSRSSDVDPDFSGVGIKQKIPLKMYLGISSCAKPGIYFGEIHYRDLCDYGYIKRGLCEYAPYFSDLEQYIRDSEYSCEGGYIINVLSELPRGAGVSFDSVFCTLLATGLHRISGKSHSNDYLPNSNNYENINNTDSHLYTIIRTAHQFESQIRGYSHISNDIAACVIDTPFPTVCYAEHVTHKNTRELIRAEDYRCFATPLNVLFPEVGNLPYAPIDFGIIYSGRPSLLENREQGNAEKELLTHLNFADMIFKHQTSSISAQRKPRFQKDFTQQPDKAVAAIKSLLGANSLETLYQLRLLYQRGYSEDDIKKCILSVTKNRHAHNVLRRSSTHLTHLITSLQQLFGYRGDLLGITYSESNSMGGSLLFMTPIEGLRKNILDTIHTLKLEFPAADVIYANRLDGNESAGLRCEQDLMQQKPSSFIDNNMLVVEKKDNLFFGSYEQLIHHHDVDVLLDTIHMKIYIHGEKVTSKELHSQTGTIEMLLVALCREGSDFSNKELPASSYSKSKNDMVGKIVIPFVKLIKQKCKKDMPLECYGSMYDYFMRLKKNTVKFGILRKVVDNHYFSEKKLTKELVTRS